jgi:hypothetical protein
MLDVRERKLVGRIVEERAAAAPERPDREEP